MVTSFSALQRAENSSIKMIDAYTFKLVGFSALQRAENSSILLRTATNALSAYVSVLFSEPKIPQCRNLRVGSARTDVSVLFSEPKIPQWAALEDQSGFCEEFQCSSASRKFLNFIRGFSTICCQPVSVLFSEPKIPQCCVSTSQPAARPSRFSALQRAENSSIELEKAEAIQRLTFQCSSASRKFLNRRSTLRASERPGRFSALQRAENSSIWRGE